MRKKHVVKGRAGCFQQVDDVGYRCVRHTACHSISQHNPEIAVVSRDRASTYAKAASEAVPQAIQVADRFHVCKNLTEATQLLLARSQAEILAVSQTENEPHSDEPTKQQINIKEWRPPEPVCVKKARLARRAGRYARYQQVVEFGQQGMTPKGIALYREIKAQGYIGSDRSVYRYLATLKQTEIQAPVNVERIKKYTPYGLSDSSLSKFRK